MSRKRRPQFRASRKNPMHFKCRRGAKSALPQRIKLGTHSAVLRPCCLLRFYLWALPAADKPLMDWISRAVNWRRVWGVILDLVKMISLGWQLKLKLATVLPALAGG